MCTGRSLQRGVAARARFAALSLVAVLAACAPQGTGPDAALRAGVGGEQTARLGTGWGEDRASAARGLNLRRASNRPLGIGQIRYSAAAPSGRPLGRVDLVAGKVSMRVLRGNGRPWPLVAQGAQPHLQGQAGERYILEFTNHSPTKTYEPRRKPMRSWPPSTGLMSSAARPAVWPIAAMSCARETVGIAGYRKSASEIAAFRFSDPAASYAANTPAESAANIGVIGAAVFALETPPPLRGAPPPPAAACGQGGACAFPADAGGPH